MSPSPYKQYKARTSMSRADYDLNLLIGHATVGMAAFCLSISHGELNISGMTFKTLVRVTSPRLICASLEHSIGAKVFD